MSKNTIALLVLVDLIMILIYGGMVAYFAWTQDVGQTVLCASIGGCWGWAYGRDIVRFREKLRG